MYIRLRFLLLSIVLLFVYSHEIPDQDPYNLQHISQVEEDTVSKFVNWLVQNGARFPKIRIGRIRNEYGVFATEQINVRFE
jgi:hypothetical protein